MAILLGLFFVAALVAPIIMRRGRYGFVLLAVVPALAFVRLCALIPAVARGRVYTERAPWVPSLGLSLDVRIDALGLLLALIATGVGTLVMVYSSRYFARTASYLGRFASIFVAFAGAMLGLTVSDNTVALYIFWELTTVFSFLLIGHYSDRATSRRAALQALIITTTGGLAMLGGLVILGTTQGGGYSLYELVNAARSGALPLDGRATAGIVLVLLGAFSKSALIPVHFWLPAAMAAPTPVSAYLHSSAMVKAGVYLVARLAPGFAPLPTWHWMVMIAGVGTLMVGGYRALVQTDVKLVIAFGTVSQLGLITIFVGYGTRPMLLAGMMLILAHALFKSALFLSVGVVDVATGTRDLRELSGIGRRLPWLATFAALADLSMMGVPPFAAFVAKEGALGSLWGGSGEDWFTLAAVALGSALTVAYGLRFWWGTFCSKQGVEDSEIGRISWVTVIPIGLLSVLGLAAGFATAPLSHLFERYVGAFGEVHSLHLWSGFGGPFLVTLGILALGVAIFAARLPWVAFVQGHRFPVSATNVYQDTVKGVERLGARVTSRYQTGSLPQYLSTIFGFLILALAIGFLTNPPAIPASVRAWDSWQQGAVALIGVAAAVLAARSRHRMKAVLLMGISGYAVALTFHLYGAPDLALTQVLAETMSLVVYVLVLRRLSPYFSEHRVPSIHRRRIVMAVLVGALFAFLAFIAAGARVADPIWPLFRAETTSFGYGANVVNVTLVDTRAWDTMGETSVVVVCAVGIASLLFVRDRRSATGTTANVMGVVQVRQERRERREYYQRQAAALMARRLRDEEQPHNGRGRDWLASSWRLRSHPEQRVAMLEIGTRLIYHSILIVSLFFLFSGHNAPGGGFAGGLLAGIALVLRYLAGGRFEVAAALPVLPSRAAGWALAILTVYVIVPVFFGGAPMQSVALDWHMAAFGHVHMTTALFFDTGVYLAVLAFIGEVLRSLGGEIDRHGALEAIDSLDVEVQPATDSRAEALDESRGQSELENRLRATKLEAQLREASGEKPRAGASGAKRGSSHREAVMAGRAGATGAHAWTPGGKAGETRAEDGTRRADSRGSDGASANDATNRAATNDERKGE